jgi:hypothetical protein
VHAEALAVRCSAGGVAGQQMFAHCEHG